MELTDGHVRLRKPRTDDAEAIAAAVRDSFAELTPWMPWAKADHSPADALEWISGVHNPDEDHFVVVDDDDRPIGTVGIHPEGDLNDRGEIGYWLATPATGNGHMTNAARLLIDYGFNELNLQRITIIMSVENEPSRRVAERVGATHEGVMRRRLLLHGRYHDAHLFAVVATDRS